VLHIRAAVGLLAAAGLDVTPAQAPVAERQSHLGIQLPTAVAEWYSLPAAHQLIATNSGDELVPLSTLGEPIPFWPDTTGQGFLDRDFLREGRLFLGSENQGVVLWAVPVDEGPDPRVMVDKSPPDGSWITFAETFSDYAETLVWDLLMFGDRFGLGHREGAPPAWHGVAAQSAPLTDAELAALTTAFEKRPRTYGWPAPTTYRFERPGQKVLIWASNDQADWWAFANTPKQLNDLIGDLWRFRDLAESLYGVTGVGEALLRGLRGHGSTR
jgi:hypothetical protein